MRHVEALYRRSAFARLFSCIGRAWAWLMRPRMIYGFVDPQTGEFRKFTRVSSSADLVHRSGLQMADHVWIFHHAIIDASNGVVIGEGCQIGAWVGIFSHGSENAIRLLGREYVQIPASQRLGYTRGKVEIGPYTFIGAGSMILPGVRIGKGCIVAAGSVVARDMPDYAVFVPATGRIVAETLESDVTAFKERDFSGTYYDAETLARVKKLLASPFRPSSES